MLVLEVARTCWLSKPEVWGLGVGGFGFRVWALGFGVSALRKVGLGPAPGLGLSRFRICSGF